MAATELDVYNMACHAVGTRDDIGAINEDSREAEVCRLWYDKVRDQVLRAAYWSSAKGYARLALAKERDDTLQWANDDPEPGYRYAYYAPNDMLAARYDSTYSRFSVGVYANQTAIMSNTPQAILVYTKSQTNVALWDSQLLLAISYALAAHIALPLTGKPTLARQRAEQANSLIIEARVSNANLENNQLDTMPEWLAARGYAGSVVDSRFYYPLGPMISVSELAGVS